MQNNNRLRQEINSSCSLRFIKSGESLLAKLQFFASQIAKWIFFQQQMGVVFRL